MALVEGAVGVLNGHGVLAETDQPPPIVHPIAPSVNAQPATPATRPPTQVPSLMHVAVLPVGAALVTVAREIGAALVGATAAGNAGEAPTSAHSQPALSTLSAGAVMKRVSPSVQPSSVLEVACMPVRERGWHASVPQKKPT